MVRYNTKYQKDIVLRYEKTINLINEYPYQIIVWRKQMWDKEDLLTLINKLSTSNKTVCPNELYQSISDCLYKSNTKQNITSTKEEEEDLNNSPIVQFILED